MNNYFDKLFGTPEESIAEFDDDKLGHLELVSGGEYWETKESEIYHSLPGDVNAPCKESIKFISDKLDNLDKYWDICSYELLETAHHWEAIDKSLSAKELFKVGGISVGTSERGEWEIFFVTKPEYKWIYVVLNFNKNEVTSKSIAT